MNHDLSLVVNEIQPAFSLIFLVFLRVGAAMALLPAFGEHTIPLRIRLALAIVFTAATFPLIGQSLQTPPNIGMANIAAEVIAGLTIGFILRCFVFALQVIGTIIAQSISLSQMLGAQNSEPQPAIGYILFWAGLCIALANDLHLRTLEAFLLSYSALPLGKIPSPSDIADISVNQISRVFSLAFSLSAPFVIASLLYNIAIGIINRAMPQLMVAMVGAPAITLGGIALLLLISPMILEIWWQSFAATLHSPFGVSR